MPRRRRRAAAARRPRCCARAATQRRARAAPPRPAPGRVGDDAAPVHATTRPALEADGARFALTPDARGGAQLRRPHVPASLKPPARPPCTCPPAARPPAARSPSSPRPWRLLATCADRDLVDRRLILVGPRWGVLRFIIATGAATARPRLRRRRRRRRRLTSLGAHGGLGCGGQGCLGGALIAGGRPAARGWPTRWRS